MSKERQQASPYTEALIQFYPCGNAVKVTAMDPATLTEVTILGPVNATEYELRRLVLQKLDYVLRKQQAG